MDGKLRVLHVVDSLEVGGLERLVHDLALTRGGEWTSVACLEAVGPFGDALRKQGVGVEFIGHRGGVIPTVWRMSRHLRLVRPNVVHCHNLPAFLYGSLAARTAGDVRVVMTKHGALQPGTGLSHRLCRFLLRRAEIAAVSPEAGQIMKEWMAGFGRPIHYIPNGISLAPYNSLPSREEARVQLGLPADSFITGIVARVSLVKGHVLLADVFARILAKLPSALLLIVGDGVGLPLVRARIQELGIGKSVHVLGERSDVPSLLAAMDVFCLPSEMEGMPMTVLEAMAASLPVVASNVGGIPEVVEEGRTGVMVPPRAADALEGALLAMADSPARRIEMGRAGRVKLLQEFSLEKTIGSYEALYEKAVA